MRKLHPELRIRCNQIVEPSSAYLYAYEDDWRVNDPVGYELYFPAK